MANLELEIASLIREQGAKRGKRLTISTAESATGGRLADRLTNVPGSSDYFLGSAVAYSNEAKINLLGVKKKTLEKEGAVSPRTAIEMAEGGRRLLGTDICLSTTGIAGPSGASPQKPLGLFYIGLAAGDKSLSQKHTFSGNREENKRDAAEAALSLLKQYLLHQLRPTGER